MFACGLCRHNLEGNFTALVRLRTERSVGFYRHPAIFGCAASYRSMRGSAEGAFCCLPQVMAGLA